MLLLLSCTPPGSEGVGGIYLNDLCTPYRAGRIGAFLPLANIESYQPNDLTADQFLSRILPMGPLRPRLSRGGILDKTIAWLQNERAFRIHLSSLLADALAFGRRLKPDKIWAVLDAPASVALALPLSQALGVPLLSLVWDDPRHISSSIGLDRLTSRRFLKHFDEAVRGSDRCAVISQPMADYFAERYRVPTVIVRHGLDVSHRSMVQNVPSLDGVFRIGYAGTMTAPCAFAALVRALDTVNWSLAGKPVELVVTGPRLDVRTQCQARVVYRGWLPSVDDSIDLLSQVDVAYLPQPFTVDRQDLARYSFPSKLTTYLAAQKPIFLHAPSYGSLAAYHCENRLGVWCSALDPQSIVQSLEPLVNDPHVWSDSCRWAAEAYERDFTTERFRSSFAQFIGAESAEIFQGSVGRCVA